jgi:predicted membrane-bound spermidine synthase
MRSRRFVLYLLVFVAGSSTMGVEMCASRLLAPYFGNSLPVWGVLIGLLLAYLATGSFLGGRVADRYPQVTLLHQLAAWAGFWIACIPYLAHPILRRSLVGFAAYQAGAVLAAFFSVVAIFGVPVILLGCVSPFAIRLCLEEATSSGAAAGRIYALSTGGSLIGTFAAVFLLIPNLGTRRSFFVISLLLLTVAVIGLLQTARRSARLYILLLMLVAALQFWSLGPIKPTQGMIYETDSAYNYIQVLRSGEQLVLKLNEGEGIQSVYHPQQVLTGYVYDYFLLVPFFRSEQFSPPVSSLCVVGLAAGTTARQYSTVFGSIPIDGIEIDPAIVDVARRFFDLNLPNLRVAVEDGRYFLSNSRHLYDVIVIDAYRPPYIPFQLTTFEFFRQVRDHLTPDGVVAINVARTETDYTLVDAVASTLKCVYPNVYIMDMLSDLNSLVIASRQPTELDVIKARLADLPLPVLRDVALRAAGRIREFSRQTGEILSDDHAPVEQIVHTIVVRYLVGQPAD